MKTHGFVPALLFIRQELIWVIPSAGSPGLFTWEVCQASYPGVHSASAETG